MTRGSLMVSVLFASTLALVGCGAVEGQTESCSGQIYCHGHGTCDDSSGVEVCDCYDGYVGSSCELCDNGYASDGAGNCVEMNPCELACSAQNRECLTIEGDIVCGDCLEGFYEEGGVCIETCAAVTNEGELVPLDLYVMLDRSSSMNDAGKWGAVTTALQNFVNSADVAGIGIGLQFFPLDPSSPIPTSCSNDGDCGIYGPCLPGFNQCSGSFASDTSCDPLDYDEAAVPIAELPGNQTMFLNALNAESAQGSATPTEQAMSGAVAYATAWAQDHPSHLTFIVFATDGEPTGCMTNSTTGAASLAADAANGTPSVKTFVIGVGSELSALNQIASSGGTGQAYLVDTGGNVTQDFINALNEIRATGACLFQIPVPDVGVPDYGLINVSLSDPADPDNSVTIFNVVDESGCDATTGGWYYDDPADPAMILLCPATCDEVRMSDWNVDILVGCTTIVG